MHRLIHILLFMLVALPSVSQDYMSCPVTEKSSMPRNIKVSYDYHYFTVRGYEVVRPMILKAGLKSYPFRWEKMFVEKDKVNNILRRYDTVGDDRFYYEEELPTFVHFKRDLGNLEDSRD